MMSMNKYVAMNNKEAFYVWAESKEQAIARVRRRVMQRFGKAQITDIKKIASKGREDGRS